MSRILIIDDNPIDRRILRGFLSGSGHECREAATGEEGLSKIEAEPFDLVLVDFMMPGINGIDVLQHIRKKFPELPALLITGMDSSDITIRAMRFGAYGFLLKPVSRSVLEKVVGQALEQSREMGVEVEVDDALLPFEVAGERIVGRSPAMRELYKQIGQVAATDATALITGESGTGKELVAHAIHQYGNRSDHVFLTINCASIPENLLESELFGYEKGAFTGANKRHQGKFEQASGGTLFLDEIGNMSALTQAKVLRVLQERTFERIGGAETIRCDVRIIAATNKDLLQAVEKGEFREDLYYRLNVIPLHLPPLRERKEDIPELCKYLLRQICQELGKPPYSLLEPAVELLQQHDWPGNIRELRNVLARAVVASSGTVLRAEDLGLETPQAAPALPGPTGFFALQQAELDLIQENLYDQVTQQLERFLLNYALERCKGNQVQATKLLGISRNMLRDRMERFGFRFGLLQDQEPAPPEAPKSFDS